MAPRRRLRAVREHLLQRGTPTTATTMQPSGSACPSSEPAGGRRDLVGYYKADGMKIPTGPPHGGPSAIPAALFDGDAAGFGPDPVLTAEEVEFFMEHGFLVKRGLIPAAKVQRALDRVWDYLEGAPLPGVKEELQLPPSGVRRQDRSSWMDAHTRWPAPDLLQGTVQRGHGSHGSTTWGRAAKLVGTPFEAAEGNAQRAPSSRSRESASWQVGTDLNAGRHMLFPSSRSAPPI